MARKKDPKIALRKKADRLWFIRNINPICENCGGKATQCHHFFPKRNFGHLRYDDDNAISLCASCHMGIHHRGDPTINETIIKNRGNKWYEALKKKAFNRPKGTYITVGWYREQIKRLEE
jgi:5-methylcytosine-specific restriction endonuclease McrA